MVESKNGKTGKSQAGATVGGPAKAGAKAGGPAKAGAKAGGPAKAGAKAGGPARKPRARKPKETAPPEVSTNGRVYNLEEIAVASGFVIVGGILLASALLGSGDEDSFGQRVSQNIKQYVSLNIPSM